MDKSAGTPNRELRGKWLGFEEQNSLNKSNNGMSRNTIIPRKKQSTLLLDLNLGRNARLAQNNKTNTVINPIVLSRSGEHKLSALAGNNRNIGNDNSNNNK